MSFTKNNRMRCDGCFKFIRYPFDSRTTFGCADPEAPEPYDPDDYCRKCSNEMYRRLLKGYLCCARSGDWMKSKAEIRAAKEAELTWVGQSGFSSQTGRYIYHQYLSKWELKYFVEHLAYEKQRREENRCKCWRKKNAEGNCERCNHHELHCLCIYERQTLPF